jgi:hypothetical protein
MNTYTLIFDSPSLRRTGDSIKVIKAKSLKEAFNKGCNEHNDYLQGVPCYYGGFNILNHISVHWDN